MPICWSAVKSSMGSDCWVRSCPITVGRPKQARALLWPIFSSIGRTDKPPARRARPVLGGVGQESGWKSSLPKKSVPVVLFAAIVLARRRRAAFCICVRKRLMRHFRHDDRNSRRKRFGSSMPHERVLKGRTHKLSGGWGCDEHATMG